MYAGITRAEQNLMLLQSMIPEGEKLYIWCYDADGRYIASSCPDPFKTMLTKAFRETNRRKPAPDPRLSHRHAVGGHV